MAMDSRWSARGRRDQRSKLAIRADVPPVQRATGRLGPAAGDRVRRSTSSSSFEWTSARYLNSFITPSTLRDAVLANRQGAISASS